MKSSARYVWVVVSCVFLAGCATGGHLHSEGLDEIAQGQYESGVEKLIEASNRNPDNMTFKLDLKTQRERIVQTLIKQAEIEVDQTRYEAAIATYRRVLTFESRNGRALRGLDSIDQKKRHNQEVSQAEKLRDAGHVEESKAILRDVLAEDPTAQAARTMLNAIQTSEEPANIVPALAGRDGQLVTLQFREADTQMVFEVLSRQTGINFIFDKDVQKSKTSIYVQQVPIEQAIDLVIAQNQLARQILSSNMVLIYPNTPAKQKDYQQQIVKTFYLTNAVPKVFADMLGKMLNVETIFVDERSSAVIIRDTPEVVRMSERLMASIDVPEAEVMMEVEVLEITRSRLQQLGIDYPGSATINPTPLAGDPLVLADLSEQDRTTLTVSPVPVTIDLHKEAGISNLLASPRIRARNNEKAKILIGQRVPTITNSVTPTSSGSSVVTGSVQYVDVGLTLEVQPRVHLDGEVAIYVDLEVSNLIREISNPTSGTLAYQIGTRNASTVLRLRDGETQILAGLIQDTDRSSSNHIPGLGDMPLIGRLFGTKKNDFEKTEIVLSITPRIVRHQPRAPSDSTEFWFGTASKSQSSLASVARTSRLRRVAEDATDAVDRADSDADSDRDAPPPTRLALDWEGPKSVSVGENFTVQLQISSATPVDTLRSQLRYDQAALELVSSEMGSIVPSHLSTDAIDMRKGRTRVSLEGLGQDSIRGEGQLVTLQFKSLVARPGTMISVQQFSANGIDGRSIPVMAPRPFVLSIKP